jgi:hypothetical protein
VPGAAIGAREPLFLRRFFVPVPSPSGAPSPPARFLDTLGVFGGLDSLGGLGSLAFFAGVRTIGATGGGARRSIISATVLCIGVCSYFTSMVLVDLTKAILTDPRQSKAGRAVYIRQQWQAPHTQERKRTQMNRILSALLAPFRNSCFGRAFGGLTTPCLPRVLADVGERPAVLAS